MLLELFYAGGNDRPGDTELSRGLGETLGLGDANKGLDILKEVHQLSSEKSILEV
jgi:hypothetical protein